MNVSTPAEQGLSLNKGEILQGSVHSIKDGGLLTLLLKGRIIEAVTQVPVNSGEQLFLQVDGIRDGRIYLKILTPIELQQAQSTNLASSLLDIGVAPGKENLMIARVLLDNALPVTADNISSVSRGAAILGGLLEENVQAAAFALSRGIKTDLQLLPAVKQLLDPKSNLARIVESLIKNITNLEEQAASVRVNTAEKGIDTPSGPIRDDTGRAATRYDFEINKSARSSSGQESAAKQSSINITGRNTPVSNKDTDLVLKPLITSAGTAGTEPAAGESKQDQTISWGPAAGEGKLDLAAIRESTVVLPASREDVSADLFKQLPFLKQLLEEVIIRLPGDSEETPQKLENVLQSVRDIVRGIMLLEEIVRKEPEIQSKNFLNELLNRLETLERELSGPRIYNYANRGSIDNQSSGYYFSLPVQIEDQTHLLELRLNKDPGKKSLKDQDSIKLVVSLETGRMGMVLFHINWQRQGSLDLQGVVEKAAVQKHLEIGLGVLVNQLKNLGYTVNSKGIKVAENPGETASLKKALPHQNEKTKTFAIDIII
ncbi:hypothetical protein ASZ90_017998 [hydrocarbon metagenome]|uniref:Flagellar hook-length control protein-like C-terminal domain-containing protein n=1 Tax=hydrocarbon metagenome TaxID=938273 RepID=A0A0W8E869_9ZZZZ